MPPRSPRLANRLLATFDLDCGELVPGHRLIARGLADEGRSSDDFLGGTDNVEQQMIGLEYEPVPGITAEEAAAAGVKDLTVDAGYSVAAGHPNGAPEPAGQVVVDLGTGTARWNPA